MALDVMRNPPTAVTTITWYRAADTTPFAVAGDGGGIGPMLVVMKDGLVHASWFGDDGWTWPNGVAMKDEDVEAFALMPEAPNTFEAISEGASK